MHHSFNIGNTSICLLNCHLAHGKSSTQKRFEEIKTIYSTHLDKAQSKVVRDHDVKILFGDLNFRIEMDDDLTCQLTKLKDFETLMSCDQLLAQSRYCSFLPRLKEAPIRFAPTYKFAKNTSAYEVTKRPPAWCDRILWGDKDPVTCLHYNSVDSLCCSDHKPVYGVYSVTVKETVEVRSVARAKEEEKVGVRCEEEKTEVCEVAKSRCAGYKDMKERDVKENGEGNRKGEVERVKELEVIMQYF
eukprot:TRINITY_DN2917_c0_g10_i1.p1 TRINITY_DN2917_c0_g10~~TRINITY_DN2917_c0_g10_i1.p1  ORF type:complete len:245 (-),score=85.75 TRINITY_DN2917_c0_g10_i1:117-851(-)